MTLTRAKPAGWITPDPITDTHINHIDVELVKALDGVGGGTYAGDPLMLATFFHRAGDFQPVLERAIDTALDDAIAWGPRQAAGDAAALVVVGNGAPWVRRSEDEGRTWSTPTGAFGAAQHHVATDGAGTWLVAPSSATTLWRSTDNALTFAATAALGGLTTNVEFLVWNEALGLWICTGDNAAGYIATSPTGAVWTQRTSAFAAPLGAIAVGPAGRTVIVRYENNSGTAVQRSDDGITWTSVTLPGGAATTAAVAYSAVLSAWLIVGKDGSVWLSTDNAVTFTKVRAAGSAYFYDVKAVGRAWVAVGAYAGGSYTVRWSTDNGATWEAAVLADGVGIARTGRQMAIALNRLAMVADDLVLLTPAVGAGEALL